MHIIAEITYSCPANCDFCPLKEEDKVTMPLDGFSRALSLFDRYLKPKRKLLTISGGEPSTCEELPEFVYEAKRLGYTTTVVTNGWNPDRILISKPDFVEISVDYYGSKHDMSRKFPLWTGVRRLLYYIKQGKLRGFIRFTLMNDNLRDLKMIREDLDNIGLQDVKIYAMPIRNCPERRPGEREIFEAMNYAVLPSRCPAGKGQFVLTPDFRVLDCLFHRQVLGRLKDFTFDELEAILVNGREIEKYPCGEPYWWGERETP